MDVTGAGPVKSTGIQQQSCSSSSSILSEEETGRKRAEEYSSCFHPLGSGISYTNGASPAWYHIPNSMQVVASGAHHNHSGNSAAYFHWPPSSRLHGTAEERAAYFSGLQKDAHLHAHLQAHDESERDHSGTPLGQQASTLLDLMTIRAFHSKLLRRFSLGTAIGFRNQRGVVTNIPAIIVFVAHKVHKEWLNVYQLLPRFLEGPGGIWCDVDVVEFSYYGTPAVTPKEQVYTELVEGLRGNNSCIGPGAQVASQETYGTLGAIVQSKTGSKRIGFLTNRHVAVDLDYPNQKMFHPLPPNLGPGVYLGAVERATSFITDDLWYGIFASMNPETFVRADGAFIPFGDCFDLSRVTTTVKGLGDIGDVMIIDLQASVGSIVGRQVVKVGRSSGLTSGRIMAYALEYNDEKGICFFTDFLIVGENQQAFDLEGDSGSLILITEEGGRKPRPVGIIWGGTANRGRLKLRTGYGPENWTSGVDLGRLLDLLQLSLITSDAGLAAAAEKQRNGTSRFLASSSQQEPHLSLFGDEGPHNIPQHQQDLGRSREVQTTRHTDNSTQTTLGFLDFGFSSPEGAGDKGKGPSRVDDETSENEELSIGFKLFARDIKKRKP